MNPSLSFIILDYFKAEKVLENIRGICSQNYNGNIEVIIGDNSENKKNSEILKKGIEKMKHEYKNIKFILEIFIKNNGYSIGNNQLAKKATGNYLCILNPDIEWEDEQTIGDLLTHLEENKNIGIISPRQQERTGREALNIRSFPSFFTQIARRTFLRNIHPFSKKVEKDEMRHIDRNITQEVDWVQSSFLIISNELWKELGGFDERYFLFLADTQLCKEVWKMKKKVIYHAETIVFSDGIRCSDGGFLSFFTSKTLRIHVWDSLKYFLK